MSLGQHLVELRKRLTRGALAIVAGTVGGWFLYDIVWTLIRDLSAASHTIVLATHSFNEALAVGQSIAILAHGKIAGQRSLAGIVTPDQLRSYYFKTTGEHDETLAAEVRGAR